MLIDFWATWCGPCIAELPNVMKTYDQNRRKGFEVIGISLDKSAESLKKFVASKKVPWPQCFDEKGEFKKQFKVQAIPATFLVNKQGKIVKTDIRGAALPDAVAKWLKEK